MQIVKLQSGLLAHRLSQSEQDQVWKELDVDTSVIGKNIPLYTPKDNIEYFIVSEVETSFEKYTVTIKVGGVEVSFKCNLCNQQVKTNEAVRKQFNKK